MNPNHPIAYDVWTIVDIKEHIRITGQRELSTGELEELMERLQDSDPQYGQSWNRVDEIIEEILEEVGYYE